jgi:hypothetical protein
MLLSRAIRQTTVTPGRYNRVNLNLPPATRILAVCIFAALGVAAVSAKLHTRRAELPPPSLRLTPDRIVADGYDTALLSIETSAPGKPAVTFSGARGLRVEKLSGGDGKWTARIRAGVIRGTANARVELPGAAPASMKLELSPDSRDSAEDGTPDFLRFEDERDQQSFRRWFTYLAEAQYFQAPEARPAEIVDCAALIRYAYREALALHDGAWAASARLPMVPAFDSPVKYQFPFTPVGPALFRTRPGPYRESDLGDGTFLQFADAHTLWRYNSHGIGRDLSGAVPGDLIFFRQPAGREPYHSMIYIGPSQIHPDGKRYVLYHTGPEGSDPGEIKRLTVEELMRFPQTEWRPLPSNPAYLGVSRWNILRRGSA